MDQCSAQAASIYIALYTKTHPHPHQACASLSISLFYTFYTPNLRTTTPTLQKKKYNYNQTRCTKFGLCCATPSIPSDNQCTSDLSCAPDQACLQGRCANPCAAPHACGLNAVCRTVGHRPRCSCPNCFVGRPDRECRRDPQCDIITATGTPLLDPTSDPTGTDSRTPGPSCRSDADCADSERCDASASSAADPFFSPAVGRCSDPCQRRRCDGNKKCETRRHRPMCVCKSGFAVNENGELQCAPDRQECVRDADCSSDLACHSFRCRDPCVPRAASGGGGRPRQQICPADKSCQVRDHQPVCICMKDCSPSASICLRDSGCPVGQACRNYQCVDPCATASCAPRSTCSVVGHRPVCATCPAGFVADARTGCQKGKHTDTHTHKPTRRKKERERERYM